MKRPVIGLDTAGADFWADRPYRTTDSTYHAHRLRAFHRLLASIDLQGAICVDFGCGDGVFTEHLVTMFGAAHVIGIDPSERLLQTARARGSSIAYTPGSVEAMAEIPSASVHCITALNVLAYLSDAEETAFYLAAHRILREGGSLIVSHSNRLFDLYACNRLTVEFFRDEFGTDIRALADWPPDRQAAHYRVRENPLQYSAKLARYGFREVQQEFAHYHAVPPGLSPEPDSAIDKQPYQDTWDWPAEDAWKLRFMCSMFGSRSVVRP